MTPEERQVITGIFERLRAAENHPRDPEAEQLIADLVARQPYAPYAMAQSLYVGEQALANLSQRNADLERQLREAQEKPQSGGFLSSLFGGARPEPQDGRVEPQDYRPGVASSASPWGPPRQAYPPSQQGYPPSQSGYPPGAGGAYPQPGPWGGQPRGGGFLQGAMTTAAGVAGGMVLANVLTSAFSHAGTGIGSGFGSTGLGTAGGLGTGVGALGFGSGETSRTTSSADSGGFPGSNVGGATQDASLRSDVDAPNREGTQTAQGVDNLDNAGGREDSLQQGGFSNANYVDDDDTGSFDDAGSLDDDSGFTDDV